MGRIAVLSRGTSVFVCWGTTSTSQKPYSRLQTDDWAQTAMYCAQQYIAIGNKFRVLIDFLNLSFDFEKNLSLTSLLSRHAYLSVPVSTQALPSHMSQVIWSSTAASNWVLFIIQFITPPASRHTAPHRAELLEPNYQPTLLCLMSILILAILMLVSTIHSYTIGSQAAACLTTSSIQKSK